MTYKEKLKELGWKKIIALTVLAAIDMFIIAMPYYIKSAIPNFYLRMHVDESVLLQAGAIIGWVTLISQIPGGWLADRFSNKILLLIGIASTFAGGVWFSMLIMFGEGMTYLDVQYYIIFTLWGISTTPFFWAPLWKLVSQQTTKENQGLAYSIQGAFNGLVGFVITGLIGFFIITYSDMYIRENHPEYSNYLVGGYMLLFCFMMLILFIALIVFVQEKRTKETNATSFKTLIRVMSDWRVWALSILLLGMYMFQSTFTYYLNQLIANTVLTKIGLSTSILTILFAFRIYGLRILVGGVLSKFSDRMRSFVLALLITTGIGLILGMIMLFIPGFMDNAWMGYSKTGAIIAFVIMNVIFFMLQICSWTMVTLRYAQQGEIWAPKNSYGTVTAVFSFIGFSSDAWFSQIGSIVVKQYEEVGSDGIKTTNPVAYQVMAIIGAVVCVIGILCGLAVYISNQRFNKKHGLTFHRWREVQNV